MHDDMTIPTDAGALRALAEAMQRSATQPLPRTVDMVSWIARLKRVRPE
jgi:hypothetical protein